jgi:hypothetical protein
MNITRIDVIEGAAIDLAARIAPWAAPLPTAYLVGRATVNHLAWPVWVGVVAAAIVESLGLATTSTALELYQHNTGKRKTDPAAPFALAGLLVGVYFVVATGLTVLLDIAPGLATYAPAIFPGLSLVGVTVLALRFDHRRRLAAIEAEKAERKAERQTKRQTTNQGTAKTATKPGDLLTMLDMARAGQKAKLEARLDALVDACADNPNLTPTEAARLLGVSRQTIYSYVDTLRNAGRLHKNGAGWEVGR